MATDKLNKKNKSADDYLKEALDLLQEGVSKVFDSDKYKEYLKCCSMFHSYSLNNIILIWSQQPNASQVAGYTTWKKLGRYPKRNIHGIRILAPAPFKVKAERNVVDKNTGDYILDEDGNKRTEIVDIDVMRYKAVTVFDISQTEGEPLPSIADELAGEVDGYRNMIKALIRTSKVPVDFRDIPVAHGFYSRKENIIAVNAGMSERQTIKTLIHEIAHSELHSDIPKLFGNPDEFRSRNQEEVEAESVAYAVCCYYGIDTSDYSFEYVAGWSSEREVTELKKSLDLIRSTASKIISRTDKEINLIKAQVENEKNNVSAKEAITI